MPRSSALAFLLVLAGPAAAEDAEARKELLRRMMNLQSIAFTAPVVSYCRSASPQLQKPLEDGYVNYLSLVDDAREKWIEGLDREALAASPSEEDLKEMAAEVETVSVRLLAAVRERDPAEYCAALAKKLQGYTADAAARSLAGARARMEAAR